MNHAFMHERHTMTPFGFVEIGRGDKDRQAIGSEVRQHIPELAAGDRIDTRGWLVEKKDARLRN